MDGPSGLPYVGDPISNKTFRPHLAGLRVLMWFPLTVYTRKVRIRSISITRLLHDLSVCSTSGTYDSRQEDRESADR